MSSELACELLIKDSGQARAFLKSLEGICFQSDTALFKAKAKGVFVLVTDPDELCASEVRLLVSKDVQLSLYFSEFSVKVMLESFINHLKTLLNIKRPVHLSGSTDHRLFIVDGGRKVMVDTAEHRPRTFFVLSSRAFQASAGHKFAKFKILSVELNRIITSHAIISGTNGGETVISVEPSDDTDGVITLATASNVCGTAVTRIKTSSKTRDVPLLCIPSEPVKCKILLTFLKRAFATIASSLDHVTVFLSDHGLMLQTQQKHGIETVVFVSDTSDMDLGSLGAIVNKSSHSNQSKPEEQTKPCYDAP